MAKKITLIICCLIFISSFFFYSIRNNNKYKFVREEGTPVVGLLKTYGSLITCTFKIDSTQYSKTMDEPYPGIVDTERFKVYYHKKYPDIFYISFAEPIIDSTFCSVNCVDLIWKTKTVINFTYSIDGELYSKFQKVNFIKELLSTDVSIYYQKHNPRIAYAIINNPKE